MIYNFDGNFNTYSIFNPSELGGSSGDTRDRVHNILVLEGQSDGERLFYIDILHTADQFSAANHFFLSLFSYSKRGEIDLILTNGGLSKYMSVLSGRQ